MRKVGRVLVSAVVAALLVAACGKEEAAPAARAPVATTTPKATTSTTADVLQLDTGGDDPVEAFYNLWTVRRAMFQGPRPELLDRIYEPTCECYASAKEWLDELVAKGLHHSDLGPTILSVSLVERRGPDDAILRIVSDNGVQVIVDSQGNRHDEVPATQREAGFVTLVRVDARWLVHAFERAEE